MPMSKKSFTEVTWREDPWFQGLCDAIRACRTRTDIADFLRDIGTLSELQAWSERYEVARLLKAGMTYRAVASKTGASTTTVSRVASFLQNGEGGYRRALQNHHAHASTPRGERMASRA